MRIFFTAALTFLLCKVTFGQNLWHTEILGRPTDNSITVQLIFTDSADVQVQYGTTSGVYPNQTTWQTFADSVPAEIIVSGLIANTKYYYRVSYRKHGTTIVTNRPEHTFQTQRPTGTAFKFAVQADPHLDASSDTALYRRCLQNQLADNPDFMIDLGDFLMTDKLLNSSHIVPFDTIPYRCNLLRSKYEISCHSMPLFNVIGNHEGEEGWYNVSPPNNIAIWDAQQRTKYFVNPYPNNFYSGDTSNTPYVGKRESFYSWQWGDALFIVIDPYWYTTPKPDSLHGWYWTLGKYQYDWLRNTLQNSTAKFKFVFSHQIVGGDPQGRGGIEYANLYEWGGNNLDGTPGFATNRPGWYKPIKDLLTENHVNIFFHGHDHFFGQQEKDCMVYQETPQPSLPNFNYPTQAAQYGYVQGLIIANTGHLRVTVDSSGVKVEYVRAYLPAQVTATHHNQDVSATYFIGSKNCYDSLATGVPVLWNSNYTNELVYPNPFGQETIIQFSLEKPQSTSLVVYDEKGQLVRRLIAGSVISTGKFQVNWDGKDTYGNLLPNGVYWYSLKVGDNTPKTGKMILMKQ